MSCRGGVGHVGVGWVIQEWRVSHLSDKLLIKLFSEFLCNSL